jgi:ATP-dependent RNA helicase DDX54/DBP10
MQVLDIVKQTAESRQVLLFSATLPSALAEFTRLGLNSPEFVRLDADTKLSPDLQLQFFSVRAPDKPAVLLQVLLDVIPKNSPTIVFAATKHQVEYLSLLLEQVRPRCWVVVMDLKCPFPVLP